MIRYISDLHLGHENIVAYDNRPFGSVEEMNRAIVELWNETVSKTDTTYIIGDVVWQSSYSVWEKYLNSMNGKKMIVRGNHDESRTLKKLKANGVIEDFGYQMVVKDNGRHVVLNHSPMPFFINQHVDGWYHLYGHTHVSFDYQIIRHTRRVISELYQHDIKMYNVGCMVPGMDYIPRTLDEIIEIDKRHFDEEFVAHRKHGAKWHDGQ